MSTRLISNRSNMLNAGALRGVNWTGALGISIAALAIGGLVLANMLPSFTTAMISSSPGEGRVSALDTVIEEHIDAQALAQKRFNQRSFFFMPPAPKPKVLPQPPKPAPPPEEIKDPGPVPPPASYTGPKTPYSLLGDSVYFSDGTQLGVGQEDQGVKVLAVDAPWGVKLGHLGGEYDITVTFKNSQDFFKDYFAGKSTETPGIVAADSTEDLFKGLKAAANAASAPKTPSGAGRAKDPEANAEDAKRAEAEQAKREADGEAKSDGEAPPAEAAGAPPVPPEPAAPAAPPPLSKEEIDKLDRAAAIKALGAVTRAKSNKDLDEATKKRLDEEFKMLMDRVRAAAQK